MKWEVKQQKVVPYASQAVATLWIWTSYRSYASSEFPLGVELLHLLHRAGQVPLVQDVVLGVDPRVSQGLAGRQAFRGVHHQQLTDQVLFFHTYIQTCAGW